MIKDIYLVWSKNFLVFKKSPVSTILLLVLEPIIVLFALGKGLGTLIKSINGLSYIDYYFIGRICNSALNITFHEGTYSTMSKISFQNTYLSMALAGIKRTHIAIGELLWCATKGLLSALLTIAISISLGVGTIDVLYALPFVFLLCLIFAAFSMSLAAKAHSHIVISGLFTIIILPMTFVSGTFFPSNNLPPLLQLFAQSLPLSHALMICRSAAHRDLLQVAPIHFIIFGAYFILAMACYCFTFNKKLSEI